MPTSCLASPGRMSKSRSPRSVKGSRWLSEKPGQRWTEIFFLKYSVVWISLMALILATRAYEEFEEWSYMVVGLAIALPCFLAPLTLSPDQGEPTTPLSRRYFVKANLWIAIWSFIGNYFWTHYFYNLLGATYTFKAHRLNNVPVALIFFTHAYFCTYHTLSTLLIRRMRTSELYQAASTCAKLVWNCLLIGGFSYFTAFMETLTIASFPYYSFENRSLMYSIGSICYGIYFIVSFPMYYRLDSGQEKWTLGRTMIDALGGCMLVTTLLDFWRISLGGIVENVPSCVPFL